MCKYAFTGLLVVLYLCWPIALSIILGSKLNHCPRFYAVIQAGHAFWRASCESRHMPSSPHNRERTRHFAAMQASLPHLHTGNQIQAE